MKKITKMTERKGKGFNYKKIFFLGLLSFLNLLSVESTTIGRSEWSQPYRTAHPSIKDSVLKNIKNPDVLAWEAWLQEDSADKNSNGETSGFESSNLPRRLTAKSIFIAPALSACAEGYISDEMGRCVKNVNLNEEAHRDFLLQRLNEMFANKPPPSQPTGPLQFHIPVSLDALNPRETTKTEDQVTDPPKISAEKKNTDEKIKKNKEKVEAIYEAQEVHENEEKEVDNIKPFFLENQSTEYDKSNDQSTTVDTGQLIPVVDFIEEKNSNTSEIIVDYKIPIIPLSHTFDALKNEKNDEARETLQKPLNDSPITSSTMLPTSNPIEHSIIEHNMNVGDVIIELKNSRNESDAVTPSKEISRVSTPMMGLVDSSTGSLNVSTDNEKAYIVAEKQLGSIDSELETTHEEDFEDSIENEDEILKHSEAGRGITLSPKKFPTTLMYFNDEKEGSRISSEVTINDDFIRETTLIDLDINKTVDSTKDSITYSKQNSVTSIEGLTDTSDTSELKIKPETTLRSEEINTSAMKSEEEEITTSESMQTTDEVITESSGEVVEKQTSFPTTIDTTIFLTTSQNINPVLRIEDVTGDIINQKVVFPNSNNDDRPITTSDETDNSEIMIASSTNAVVTVLPRGESEEVYSSAFLANKLFNQKRTGPQSAERLETNQPSSSSINNAKEIYNYEPVSRVYPNSDPYKIDDSQPVIKTIDDQNEHSGQVQNFYSERFGSGYDFRDYVRFPSRDNSYPRAGHIRFPTEEANSIHRLNDFKEQFHRRPYALQSHRGLSKTGSEGIKHNRMDRQQNLPRSRSRVSEQRQKGRLSMLRDTWRAMPLIQDPSYYSQSDQRSSSSVSRRTNLYRTSPRELTGKFAGSSPIGG